MHNSWWADEDDEEYETEVELPTFDTAPDPQEWMDRNSTELIDTYHKLKDEAHLTGVLQSCDVNDFCHACYTWACFGPVLIEHTKDEQVRDSVTRHHIDGLYKTFIKCIESTVARGVTFDDFVAFCMMYTPTRVM